MRSRVARLICDAAVIAVCHHIAMAAVDFYGLSMQATMRHQKFIFANSFSSLVEIKLYEDASDKKYAYRHAMKVIHLNVQGNLTLEVLFRIQNI